ncbi:hypothetical protein DXG01_012364 [Tephrocybe rancida]|nr:hypothetical protein DXG01_012364 [Tephrocybe rancida]
MTATTTVPSDIWQEVFTQCLPWEDIDSQFLKPSTSTAPLLLRQVCRSWRDLADSIATLWSSLSIKVSRDGCIPRADLVSTWLARAHGQPLDISVTLDTRPGPSAFENAELALLSITPFFGTWRHIVVLLGPFVSLDRLGQMIPSTISPYFKSFHWDFPDSYERAAGNLEHIFSHAPQLRDLNLSSEICANHIVDLMVPFTNLTSLTLSNAVFTIQNCCEVLKQCINLTRFQAFLQGQFEMPTFVNKPPTILPNLQTFGISSTSMDIHLVFEAFTFPSLLPGTPTEVILQPDFTATRRRHVRGRSTNVLAELSQD